MPRYTYLHGSGAGKGTAGAGSIAEMKREFARRLQGARTNAGINQSELARRAARFMEDKKFGRDLVGLYERARSLPSPMHLSALARALHLDTQDLLPYRGTPVDEGRSGPGDASVSGLDNGLAWVRISKQLPWDVALRVMEMVNTPLPSEQDADKSKK